MAPFSMPVILHHLGLGLLPVGPFPDGTLTVKYFHWWAT